MITIDDLLTKIEKFGIDTLPPSVPNKDKRILKNLAKMIKMPAFITEAQGKLLIKILQENLEAFNFVGAELIPSLKLPTWSRAFRVNDIVRKISIEKVNNNPVIDVEFTFNKDVKKAILEALKNSEGSIHPTDNSGRHIQVTLTEKNLYNIVTGLKRFNFNKTEQVQSLFNDISKIDRKEVYKQFNLFSITNEKLLTKLTREVKTIDSNNQLLLEDRKIRYQYMLSNDPLPQDSLTNKIASRNGPKIFINSKDYSLLELGQSLKELNRMPVLFIFDEYNAPASLENLKALKQALDTLGARFNVGVYFRFKNEGDGETFNKLVSDYGYNQRLDEHNRVSVIPNGKIPKFFLTSDWYPKAVISFSNQFRNNKTSVYCNQCDLIIYYNTQPPVIGTVDAIV